MNDFAVSSITVPKITKKYDIIFLCVGLTPEMGVGSSGMTY